MGLIDDLIEIGIGIGVSVLREKSSVFDNLCDSAEQDYERRKGEVYRKVDRVNKKIDKYEETHNTPEGRKKADEMRGMMYSDSASSKSATKRKRRTDKEFEDDTSEVDKKPTDFQVVKRMPLSAAKAVAQAHEGVYIIYLDGQVMKCGRAAYGQGIKWRFTQYYNLNYDKKARNKEYWSITPENRDDVVVSWQCCPASKCGELLYKLFKKYGKGPWAKRAPNTCTQDTWELLI